MHDRVGSMLVRSSSSMAGDLDPMVKMESTKASRFNKTRNFSIFGKMIVEQPPELEYTMMMTKGNTFAKAATKTSLPMKMKMSFLSPKTNFKSRTFK